MIFQISFVPNVISDFFFSNLYLKIYFLNQQETHGVKRFPPPFPGTGCLLHITYTQVICIYKTNNNSNRMCLIYLAILEANN